LVFSASLNREIKNREEHVADIGCTQASSARRLLYHYETILKRPFAVSYGSDEKRQGLREPNENRATVTGTAIAGDDLADKPGTLGAFRSSN
jgi:hypothetical protein